MSVNTDGQIGALWPEFQLLKRSRVPGILDRLGRAFPADVQVSYVSILDHFPKDGLVHGILPSVDDFNSMLAFDNWFPEYVSWAVIQQWGITWLLPGRTAYTQLGEKSILYEHILYREAVITGCKAVIQLHRVTRMTMRKFYRAQGLPLEETLIRFTGLPF